MGAVVFARRPRPFPPSRSRVVFVAGAGALALTLTLTACGGGGGKKTKGTTPTTVRQLVVKTTNLKSGKTNIETAGPLAGIDDATGAAVLHAAQKYLETAVFSPLSDGQVGAGYGALFDPGVRAAATGSDEAALTDVAVGKVNGYTEAATPVAFTGLVDLTGTLLYVATNFDVKVNATTDAGPLSIDHKIELTFGPGANKTWIVTAYRVHTTRSTPRPKTATSTTTAVSAVSKP